MLQTRSSSQWTKVPMPCPGRVLLVEDDPVDAALLAHVFQETRASNRLVHFDDCRRALMHLRSRSEEKPVLILLSLNVPDGSAFHFLETLKADDTLRTIPVVALAESNEKRDVSASFALGVAGYMIKSGDLARLQEDVAAICAYWALSRLPRS